MSDPIFRFTSTYEGIVQEVHEDEFVVTFDVGDDIVEQQYKFVGGKPEVGARLIVVVSVIEIPRDNFVCDGTWRAVQREAEVIALDEKRSKRTQITGDHRF